MSDICFEIIIKIVCVDGWNDYDNVCVYVLLE